MSRNRSSYFGLFPVSDGVIGYRGPLEELDVGGDLAASVMRAMFETLGETTPKRLIVVGTLGLLISVDPVSELYRGVRFRSPIPANVASEIMVFFISQATGHVNIIEDFSAFEYVT